MEVYHHNNDNVSPEMNPAYLALRILADIFPKEHYDNLFEKCSAEFA